MKFKVLKGTELFKKLIAIQKEMQDCHNQAQKIVDTIPEADGFSKRSHVMAGGIGAFHFKEYSRVAKDGWKKMEGGWTAWFMPKAGDKRNKDLIEKINNLPVLDFEPLNKLLNFNFFVTGILEVWHCPIVEWCDNYILIEIPDDYKKYKPAEGMIEIVGSEYSKLTKKYADKGNSKADRKGKKAVQSA